MSYKPNTYIDDVAFKQALTAYNNKIKDTYADIPQVNNGVDTRYLVGAASSSGTGDVNSPLYKSSSLKYSETNKKLETPNIVECPQCHEYKLPHKVCKACGYYKGKAVSIKSADYVEAKEEQKPAKKTSAKKATKKVEEKVEETKAEEKTEEVKAETEEKTEE